MTDERTIALKPVETVVLTRGKDWLARVDLCQHEGSWYFGPWVKFGGIAVGATARTFLPRAGRDPAYRTREQAIEAARKWLEEWTRREIERLMPHEAAALESAKNLLQGLTASRQMSLF